MAIDSQDKRASAGSLPGLEMLPLGDGSIGAADRLQAAGLYCGIAAVVLLAIHGPFFADAAECFVAGSAEAEVFNAGAEAQQV